MSGLRSGQQAVVVLQSARSMMYPRPVTDRRLEDDALIVAFAMPLGLDAVVAGWPFLSAFDATLATCEAAGLGPLAKLWIAGSGVGVSHAGREASSGITQFFELKIEEGSGRPGKARSQGTRTRRR
jgi:hypothetical protein